MHPMTADHIDRLDGKAVIARWQLHRLRQTTSSQKRDASVLRRYEVWCLRNGVVACPGSAETVETFLDAVGIENTGTRYTYRKAIAAGHAALGVATDIMEGLQPQSSRKGNPNAATATASATLHAQLRSLAGALLDPGHTPPQAMAPSPGVAAELERATARALLEEEAASTRSGRDAATVDEDAEPITLTTEERYDLEILERRAEALEYLDETVLKAERSAHAKNTWLAYRARLMIYLGFCYALGLQPYPASPDNVCRFLTWYGLDGGDGKGRAPSTLGLAKAAISHAHTLRDLPDPTAASRVKRVLAGLQKNWTTPPRKARPITSAEMRQLCAFLDRIGGAAAVRDKALILLLFAGCMRRSEVTTRAPYEYSDDPAFDLRLEQVELTEQGATIHLLKTKTTTAIETRPRHISWGTDPTTCPVLALQSWVELCARYGRTTGALFPRLRSIGDPLLGDVSFGERSISAFYLDVLTKLHAKAAGLQTERLSSHSFRRGHAHQAHRNGAPVAQIQKQGGWASLHSVGGYLDECTSEDENSSQLLGL